MKHSPRSLRWPGAKPLFMGGFCIFGRPNLTTNVYIDGFNLYYGALRNTPYRWLNLEALWQLLLPKNTMGQIKYFTALVSARPNDPDQPVLQQLYLRALGNTPQGLDT